MTATRAMLDAYSIEATTKDAAAIGALPQDMPRPAQVFVPYLHEENDDQRIAACAAIRAAGLEPVPHLSARRLEGLAELDRLLHDLREQADVRCVFVIAGDIATAAGPFNDSLSLIETGLFEKHGIENVGIAGHPDDHPEVPDNILWDAMLAKIAALEARGLQTQVVTQFSFDANRVLDWLGELRARGITVPVRIGIPGPTSVRTLLRYAARCGVAASASAVAKYGLSLSLLLGNAGPDTFLDQLNAGLDSVTSGEVRLHLFPFGGFSKVADWMEQVSRRTSSSTLFAA